MSTQPQPDPYEQQLRAILEPEKVHRSVKASAWDGFYGSNDPATFQQRFAALPGLAREAKAKLWDLKFGTIPTEEGQPSPEEMSGGGLPGTEQTGLPGVPTFKPPVEEVMSATTPLVRLPRLIGPAVEGKGTAGKVAAGVEEGALETAEGLTTPESMGILGGVMAGSAIPVVGPFIGAGAAAYFSYEMLKAMAQQAPAAYQAYKRGDYKEAAKLATQAGLSGLMAKSIVGHTAKGLGERVSRSVPGPAAVPEAPVERAPAEVAQPESLPRQAEPVRPVVPAERAPLEVTEEVPLETGVAAPSQLAPVARSGIDLARQVLAEESGQANIIKPSAQSQPPEAPKVEFKSPEVEKRFQAAGKEPERPNLWQRTKDVLKRQAELATRPYEHLPRGEKYGPLIFKLKQLEKAPGIASAQAAETLTNVTKGMDANAYDLFRKKVVMDDLLETHDSATKRGETWDELAFGLTPDQLRTEHGHITEASTSNPAVKEALAKRTEAWDTLKADYSGAMKSAGFDIGERLKREDYFRHRVLEHLQGKIALGSASRLRTPAGRSYLKGRKANALDYSTDYLSSEYEVMAQMQADIATAKAISFVRAPANGYNLTAQLKWQAAEMNKQRAEGAPRVKWQDLVPENHQLWQPREGSHFYLANSIPEKLAQQIIEAGGEELGVKADQLRKVLAKGGRFEELALPNEVVATLEQLKPPPPTGFRRGVERVQNTWKAIQLVGPEHVAKYNLRNATGDAEVTAVGNASAFTRVGESIADLAAYHRTGEMSPNLRAWFERGGFQSNLQVQELGDLKKLDDFARILARTQEGQTLAAVKRIWKLPIAATNFRESILRYANYLEYFDQVKEGGKPKNYGASIPAEVDALQKSPSFTPADSAYKLSNDLVGAYDEVSVTGQNLRKYLIPFWSYQELNFRRYYQMAKNAANDGKLASTVGRKLLTATTIAAPYRAYQVGKFALKALAFTAAVESYNLLRYPEEERELSKDVQSRPHIILGRDSKGKVDYFSRLGNMADIEEWFGFDKSIPAIQQWLSGHGTIRGVAKAIASDVPAVPISVANKVWQSLNPLEGKLLTEALSGKTTYPNFTKRRTIRDTAEYIAQAFGVGATYRYLAGKPVRPRNLGQAIKENLIYSVDPGQSAYYENQDKEREYHKARGRSTDFSNSSPRANAARNLKLSLRAGDTKAFTKYLTEYIASGGTGTTLQKSFEAMAPLYGLKQSEKLDFIRSLDDEEKKTLERAVKYYREVFAPAKVQGMVATSRKAVNQ